MTLGTTAPLIDYAENGVTLTHPIPFEFQSSTDIVCSRIIAGVETVLGDVLVTGGHGLTGSVKKANGGVIGATFRVRRVTTRGQPTNFIAHGTFATDAVEAAFDRLAAVNEEQDVGNSLSEERNLRVPVGESAGVLPAAAARKGTVLGFNLATGLRELLSYTALAGVLGPILQTLWGTIGKGDPGSPGEGYATRAAMAAAGNTANNLDDAFLAEAGRAGKFVFYTVAAYLAATGLSLTAAVTADPVQGLYVARASDLTGAHGAWVREFRGAADVRWWGALADDSPDNPPGATDNADAFDAMLNTLQARAAPLLPTSDPSHKYWWLVEPARVVGNYYLSRPLSIKTGTIQIDFTGSQLRFPADSFGIVVNSYTTDVEAARDGPYPQSSVLINPKIKGTNGSNRTRHGIWLRTKAWVIHPDVRNFGGDGIRIGNSNGHIDGNQNGWRVDSPFVQFCGGDGIHPEGGDSNQGLCTNAVIDICGRWGINDASFLGCKWVAPQVSNCGVIYPAVNTVAAFVFSGGHNWAPVVGQEVAASTTVPSLAASAIWIDMGAAGGGDPAVPAWFNGITLETGGTYRASGATCAARFDAAYHELGYAVDQLGQYAVMDCPTGGINAIRGGIVRDPFTNDRVTPGMESHYFSPTGVTRSSIGGNTVNQFATFIAEDGHQWRWLLEGGYLKLKDDSLAAQPFAINEATGRHNALDVEGAYKFNGVQVLGARQPAIANPAGGATIDGEARLAIVAILTAMRTHGQIAP